MIESKQVAIALLGLVGLLGANPALAAVINVDIAASGADATHSGSDGVLSGSGTVWNGVLFNATATDVVDENGNSTMVDVATTPFFSGGTDGSATNDLQDSGMFGNGFDIGDLVAGNTYTLAVYGGAFLSFGIADASGTTGGPCTSTTPTYALPGTAGSDYCTFSDLQPFDLGGWHHGDPGRRDRRNDHGLPDRRNLRGRESELAGPRPPERGALDTVARRDFRRVARGTPQLRSDVAPAQDGLRP